MKTRQHVPFITWLVDKRAELDARTSGSELMFVEAVRRKLNPPNYARLGLGSADECEGRN